MGTEEEYVDWHKLALAEVGHEIEEIAIRIAAVTPVDPVDVSDAIREAIEGLMTGIE